MGKIVRGILTNPLILASLLGLACMAVGLRIPSPVMSAVEDLSKIATPLALFLLGGSFEFSKVRQNRVQLFWGVMGRLVIAPAVFVSLAALLGFRGLDLASLMIVFAAPTAVNSYVMAQQMGGDADLAGQQVVFSSAFAIPSIFLWIFILKQMALI